MGIKTRPQAGKYFRYFFRRYSSLTNADFADKILPVKSYEKYGARIRQQFDIPQKDKRKRRELRERGWLLGALCLFVGKIEAQRNLTRASF